MTDPTVEHAAAAPDNAMTGVRDGPQRATVRPLPANIDGAQPGGGVCLSLELAWGRLRRWWLRRFRRGYVRRMAQRRRGDAGEVPPGAPHAILDTRDLKYCRNQCRAWWDPWDDPFRWRGRIGFARWGLAELWLIAGAFAAAAVACGVWLPMPWRWLAAVPAGLALLVAYFFRDPQRRVPEGPGVIVAPADGRVVEIVEIERDPFIDGPAVRIGVFLSIFNVHINRAPATARVLELRYHPGKFLNALDPRSARENENMWIGLEEDSPPYRRMVVRQISGAIARRIVCDLCPGEVVPRGDKFGMIKLGSRTELILPLEDGLQVAVSVGEAIRAGSSVVARYPAHGG
jgi:phosphatidylserine decarboxylase